MSAAVLKGLVLAGGRSQRMGRDKAAIQIAGEHLLGRTVRLAGRFAGSVHVGVRDTAADATRAPFDLLPDAGVGAGPMDSILAALRSDPQADWLILACDMPLLDAATLTALTSAAADQPDAAALAIADSSGELPEPLCAIWRAPMQQAIEVAFANERYCARKCLITAQASLVKPVSSTALLNMNTSDDVQIARRHGVPIA